jgi:hypothetical protein
VKTSPKRSYSVIENKRFGLVFAKTVSIISGTGVAKLTDVDLLVAWLKNFKFIHAAFRMYHISEAELTQFTDVTQSVTAYSQVL